MLNTEETETQPIILCVLLSLLLQEHLNLGVKDYIPPSPIWEASFTPGCGH